MMMKHDGRLQYIKQLKQYENEVHIRYYDNLDNYNKQIEEY